MRRRSLSCFPKLNRKRYGSATGKDRSPFLPNGCDWIFALKSNGKGIYAGCMDGIYELVLPKPEDANSKSKPTRIGSHGSYVSSVALIESSQSLLSAGYDGTYQIRKLIANEASSNESLTAVGAEEIEPIVSERLHRFWSWDMALSPDRRFAASVTGQYLAGAEDYTPLTSKEPTVKILDASTGRVLHALDMLPSVQCVAFDPSSKFLAAGNLMGDLAVWEVESGQSVGTMGAANRLPAGGSSKAIASSVECSQYLFHRIASQSMPRGWVICEIRWRAMGDSFGRGSHGDRSRWP